MRVKDSFFNQLEQDGCVLPIQFVDPQRLASSLDCLSLAVLLQSIEDWQKTSARLRSKLRREVRRWFLDTNYDYPLSYVNICERFSQSPDLLRKTFKI